jgi:hypothetical protein
MLAVESVALSSSKQGCAGICVGGVEREGRREIAMAAESNLSKPRCDAGERNRRAPRAVYWTGVLSFISIMRFSKSFWLSFSLSKF